MTTPKAGIVVGVEGTAASRAALEWALREGLLRRCRVIVVHAWSRPIGREVMRMSETEASRASACLLVAAVNEGRRAVGGDPEVVERSRRGPAAKVLLEQARDAELLVLGRGHRGGVADIVGQSVSAECVRRARCPVVIIPGAAAGGQVVDRGDVAVPGAATA